MRAVRAPSWAPESAALRLLDQMRDPAVLRLVRARLLLASRQRTTLSQTRALAILDLAIQHLHDQESDSDGVTSTPGTTRTSDGS